MRSLGKTLLAFALLHSVLQGQICLLLQYFFTSYFCIPVPYNENDIFFGCYLEGFASIHKTIQLQLIQGIDLDYCDTEWFAVETNRNHPVIFEIASKYCILDSFVDYDGYSTTSKEFLPTV